MLSMNIIRKMRLRQLGVHETIINNFLPDNSRAESTVLDFWITANNATRNERVGQVPLIY